MLQRIRVVFQPSKQFSCSHYYQPKNPNGIRSQLNKFVISLIKASRMALWYCFNVLYRRGKFIKKIQNAKQKDLINEISKAKQKCMINEIYRKKKAKQTDMINEIYRTNM
mmetsp:Transcript_33975/g.45915  ORF Transcript_33975/g.45915 Transcript_33975/m.45915 type:complete len:110 (-) Transcript_33975:120-449(-)